MNETPPATNGDSLYLIDGSGFIHRAFHAIGPLTRPDGTPVNAVFGFTNMLIRLLAEFGTHKIAVIFDAGRKNWRNDIYPDYKANRAETPEELRPQFPLVREAAEVFGLPAIEREGYEADDLIAAYTKAARAAGMNVRIVSSDKDLMQLVGEGIIMIDPIKFNQLGIDAVRDKFGVTPDKVVDVQALAGDPTDNVPGVPGIGVKTAAMLIKEYGSLDALLERAKEIGQPKRRQNLIDHAKQARISKRLVVLDADAPLPIPIDDIEAHVNDGKKRADFLKEQGFTSILARLKSQGLLDEGTTATSAATPSAIKTDYTIINDFTILDAWIKKAREAGIVAIDTETDSLTPATAKLVGLSLCIEAGRAAYVPFHHGNAPGGELALEPSAPDQLNETAALERLAPLLADPSVLKIGHNIKFDLQLFMARKMTVKPVDDTMLLSYCLDSSARGHGMDALAHDMLGIETTPFSAVAGTGRNQITFDRVPLD
ncbi:MAG: 5'-3' exonuclease H3TH domain-containing protein, partial [Pseudomonadota bacterium]|nr:5'-3' exonuclease H3TH domain-containing protein [Pseudomonadota bacterium]